MTRPTPQASLALAGVRFGFVGRPMFLGPVDLQVRGGQCWAIVGPNGVGKSTLLRLMAGLLTPAAGSVNLRGADLRSVSARERARHIAYLGQHPPHELADRVRDVVLMGRFPHRSLGLFESPRDAQIAHQAMEMTGTLAFADRPLATLSGGEAQRVHLAAALAQAPDVLLLDEPTASLDLQHQLAILRILRRLSDEHRMAVVAVTHDVNLATRFCTDVLILHEGQVAAKGSPEKVLTPAVLAPVYGVKLVTLTPETGGRPFLVACEGDAAEGAS